MAGVPILGLNPSKKFPEFDGYAVFMNEQLEGTMDEDCLTSRRIWVFGAGQWLEIRCPLRYLYRSAFVTRIRNYVFASTFYICLTRHFVIESVDNGPLWHSQEASFAQVILTKTLGP